MDIIYLRYNDFDAILCNHNGLSITLVTHFSTVVSLLCSFNLHAELPFSYNIKFVLVFWFLNFVNISFSNFKQYYYILIFIHRIQPFWWVCIQYITISWNGVIQKFFAPRGLWTLMEKLISLKTCTFLDLVNCLIYLYYKFLLQLVIQHKCIRCSKFLDY